MMFCPRCQIDSGNKVELRRDMYMFRCSFGHAYDGPQLEAMHPEMIKLQLQEQINPNAVKLIVWAMPKVKQALEEKFVGRLNVTLATVCENLVNDEVIFIDGKEAAELRRLGLKNGATVLAAVKAAKEQELENQELQKQISLLAPILRAAGITT